MANLGLIGFKGGLNTKAYAFSLGKDQMTQAQSVRLQQNDLFKINGSTLINSSALNSGVQITGLFDWQTVSQSRYLIIVSGTKIYNDSNLGTSPTDMTSSATITAGVVRTFASLNNVLAICGGTDTPLQWTGTGNVASLSGSPTAGSLVTTANNFMFISGNSTNPSGIWWSNVNDPGTWMSSSSLNFRYADGDIITAIAPLGYNVAIFKRRSTGILYTQTTSVSGAVTLAPLTQVSTYCGCAGPLAWDALPDGRLVVLGWDAHLRIFDGTTFEDISDPPPPQSNIQPNFDALNIGYIPNAVVRVYPALNQIWVAVSTASNTSNDSVFVYNYILGVWECIIPDRAISVMCTSIDSRSSPVHPIVLVSGDYGGFAYVQDSGLSNAQVSGGQINSSATVSTLLTDGEGRKFNPKSIKLPIEAQTSGNLTVGWGYDGLNTVNQTTIVSESQGGAQLDINFTLDLNAYLAGPASLIKQVPINAEPDNHTLQVQFSNPNASQPFIVHPFWISDEVLT